MAAEKLSVAVFGAGPAGLSSAMELANSGHHVEVITPDIGRFPHSVYTTTKFLTTEQREMFFGTEVVRNVPYIRVLTSQGTDLRVKAGSGKYVMVDYPKSLRLAEDKLSQHKNITFSRVRPSILKEVTIADSKHGTIVCLDGTKKEFDAAVDATGYGAKIDRTVNRNREDDYLCEYVYGISIRGDLDHDDMVLVIGPAGGTSWVNRSIECSGLLDVVFSAYGPKSQFTDFLKGAKGRLSELISFISKKPGIEIHSLEPQNTFSGLIRAQPTGKPSTNNLYAVGESAGMAKPGTGDSIQRAIRGGALLTESLNRKDSPQEFHRSWRKVWKEDDFYFAGLLARLPYQARGQLGGVIDMGGKWLTDGNVDNAQLVEQFERYLIDGKLSPQLLFKLVLSRQGSQVLVASLLKQVESFFHTPAFPRELPLPSIP